MMQKVSVKMIDEKILINKLEKVIENYKKHSEENKYKGYKKYLSLDKGVPFLLRQIIEFINNMPKEE